MKKKALDYEGKKIQQTSFIITDFKQEIRVEYKGILPDLFSEGQGVVVEGNLINDNSFNAILVLAKHDENYMPPELDNLKNAYQLNKMIAELGVFFNFNLFNI